jgi:hypothetical protein
MFSPFLALKLSILHEAVSIGQEATALISIVTICCLLNSGYGTILFSDLHHLVKFLSYPLILVGCLI